MAFLWFTREMDSFFFLRKKKCQKNIQEAVENPSFLKKSQAKKRREIYTVRQTVHSIRAWYLKCSFFFWTNRCACIVDAVNNFDCWRTRYA